MLALDRIWVPRRSVLMAARAHGSATARVASDHLPYVADIRLG
jgi:endonuclease/exonuclease/phosphatase family metal-dependent hydrolase